MTSRLSSVRPRPLDLQKQLPICRDTNELDPPVEGAKDVLYLVQQRDEEAKRAKKKSEIPIPMVKALPTYERDYLPVFLEGNTYIRGREDGPDEYKFPGGVGHRDDSFVEYDLDHEDRAWLEKFNDGQDRLPAQRFELLLWKLDLVNADANDRQSAAVGNGMPDRVSPAIVAQIGNLRKEEALQAMSKTHALRHPTLLAIYEYWREKRVKRGRPLLRSLQAPTAPSDSNPYNVFRPRDKVHRPQTRRRRENNEESLEKMKLLRQNLIRGYEILEWVTRREHRKTNLVYLEADENHMRSEMYHQPSHSREDLDTQYSQHLKSKTPKRPLHVEQATNSENPWDLSKDSFGIQKFKQRRLRHKREQIVPVQQLPSPPPSPEPEMLFTRDLDDSQVSTVMETFSQQWLEGSHPDAPLNECNSEAPELTSDPKFTRRRARIGRGGRLIFDRCDPFSGLPITDSLEGGTGASPNGVSGIEVKHEHDLQALDNPNLSLPLNGVV